MSEALDLTKLPVYERLLEHRAEMATFFASKGWELWLELSKELVDSKKRLALYDVDPRLREEARVSALAFEQFGGLAFYMAGILEDHAGSAPEIPPATE